MMQRRSVLRVVVDRLMNPGELVAKGFPKLQVEEDAKPAMSPAAAAAKRRFQSQYLMMTSTTLGLIVTMMMPQALASIVGNASPFDDVVAW
jgi:hypothetical protein